MDALDVKVLRELFGGAGGSPFAEIYRSCREIARRLRIDEETVRSRVKKLHESGFIRGWRLVVNPHLLGMRMSTVFLDIPSFVSKDNLIRQLKVLRGAVLIISYYGSSIGISFFYENEASLKRTLDLISKLSHVDGVVSVQVPVPECTCTPSETDWKIIGALEYDPRKRYNLIAKELSISPRTAERRLRRMVAGRAIFSMPSLDPRTPRGAMFADLTLHFSRGTCKQELDALVVPLLDACLVKAETGDGKHSTFNLLLSRISDADDVLRRVGELKGVARARMGLVLDRIELFDTLHEMLAKSHLSGGAAQETPPDQIRLLEALPAA